jgi:hypothetical protein
MAIVMRACEGCRRRKIKCDAATTNTWPCSACIRLKLHCVRPNGFEDADGDDAQAYDGPSQQYDAPQGISTFRQEQPLQMDQQVLAGQPKTTQSLYTPQTTYHNSTSLYQGAPYSDPTLSQSSLPYPTVAPAMGMTNPSYTSQGVFPTPPPLLHASRSGSSEEQYGADQYGQGDLANLLGNLRVTEAGTGES